MARRTRPLVVTLLFLSGATGLVYELCWSKRLANLLGNTGQAHALVLATFMGGLACGAWLFGRRADRSARPLLVYGVLELGVGLGALLFPRALELLGSLAVAPDLTGAPRLTLRLVLAAAALLPPTLLMGGTLPAMTRHMTEKLGTARRELALLYGVNSLGAAAGCLLAGMVLVPAVGLWASERAAAVVNLTLGLAAVLVGRRAVLPAAQVVPEETAPSTYGPAAVRAALLGTALAGFAAMLYETTWIRVLSVVIGGTSYAFTLIVGAFILGLALGSLWLATRPESDALRLFARLQLALVAAVCLALPLFPRLPYVFLQLSALLRPEPQAWTVYQLATFGFCGALLVGPSFLLGASFPAAARVAMRSVAGAGQSLGRVSLWNTVGTVLGALLGGLWLLPTVGLEGSLVVGLLANLLAAAVAWRAPPVPGRARWRQLLPVGLGLVLVLTSSVGSRGWAQAVASSGRFREWNRAFASYSEFRQAVRETSAVRFYRDDVFASVLVGEQPRPDGTVLRYLRINGKVDSSNGTDLDVQALLAHLGVLFHPGEVKRALIIGAGSGVTIGSMLTHGVERVDVVEISPAVLEAARLFGPDNRGALEDPRCHLHVDDARTFLASSREQYDLIVSEPSNPWVSGVAGLYTQDFFRLAREHLAERGRLVQWIHTYESSDELVRLVVRTLRDSFEHGTTWLGPQDLLLLASREPQTFEVEALARRMERPQVAEDLARVHVHAATTLLARQVHSDEAQRRYGGAGPLNTDDHNRLEYGSPIAYFAAKEVDVADERSALRGGGELELTKWTRAHPLTAAEAKDVYLDLAWVHPPADPLVRGSAEAWRALEPDSLEAALAVARAGLAQGNGEVAAAALRPFLDDGARGAEVVTAWLRVARVLRRKAGAPWRPSGVEEALALGRAAAVAHPDDEALREALERLEGRLP